MRSLVFIYFLACLLGQSAADIGVIVLIAGTLFQLGQKKDLWGDLFQATGIEWALLAWISIVALGFVVNAVPLGIASWKLAEFSWVLIVYIILFNLKLVKDVPSWATSGLLFVVSALSIYTIAIYFLGFDPTKPSLAMTPMAGGVRTGGTFRNPMTMAHALGMVWSFLVGMFLPYLSERYFSQHRTWYLGCGQRVLGLVTVSLVSLAIVFTFTRGIWLAISVSFLLGALVLSWRVFIKAGLFLIFILGIVLSSWPALRERAFSKPGDVGNYDSERVYLWQTNWNIFMENPILGLGYGENARRLPEVYEKQHAPVGQMLGHAHNQVLHWLSGTGLLGTAAALIFFFFIFSYVLKAYRYFSRESPPLHLGPEKTGSVLLVSGGRLVFFRGLSLGTFMALASFFVGGLTEANFEHYKLRYILILFVSLSLFLKFRVEKGSRDALTDHSATTH